MAGTQPEVACPRTSGGVVRVGWDTVPQSCAVHHGTNLEYSGTGTGATIALSPVSVPSIDPPLRIGQSNSGVFSLFFLIYIKIKERNNFT